MPVIPIDLTVAGLIPAGNHVGVVNKLTYQVKTGEKWNKDGTTDTTFEEWIKFADDKRRLHFNIQIPGVGGIFHDCYLMDKARSFTKQFFDACRVPFEKLGFDAELALGKEIGVTSLVQDDPERGPQNEFRFHKV